MDFFCYVSIYNRTSVDILLVDSTISQGEYDRGSPPNTIPAGKNALLVLKDKKWSLEGSAGRCAYELYLESDPDVAVGFELEYGDPFTGQNYCRFTRQSDKLDCKLHDYNISGHPLNATVEIFEKGATTITTMSVAKSLYIPPSDEEQFCEEVAAQDAQNAAPSNLSGSQPLPPMTISVMNTIGFKGSVAGITYKETPPVHETIVIAAFVGSHKRFPRGTTYTNLNDEQWEYMRGLIWNDDPQCLLFKDCASNNHELSKGVEFGEVFEGLKGGPGVMTQRSHFGDLQFLHAMSPSAGTSPQSTKDGVMTWLEVMYKVACGNQSIQSSDTLSSAFKGQYFTGSTSVTDHQSIRDLVLATTPSYASVDMQKRALGVCLHIIADSYAHGHTKRVILNPQDRDTSAPGGYLAFKSGTVGRFGDVITFHTYSGQDTKRHEHYDTLNGDLPKANNLDSFNSILGARDAIDKSTKLINFWVAKTSWDGGVKQFFNDEVFKLDAGASVSDTGID